jgi:hypothetical protein
VNGMMWVGRVCEVFWMDYGGRGWVSEFGVGGGSLCHLYGGLDEVCECCGWVVRGMGVAV